MNFLRKNWKKIVFGLVGIIIALLVITIIGIFLWMQTWKTYQFPDGQGSVSYPPTWKVKDYSMGIYVSLYDEANKVTLSFARYYPAWNVKTADDDAKARIREDQDYLGMISTNEVIVDGEKGYSAEFRDKSGYVQTIETSHNGYEYEFTIGYPDTGIFGLWNKIIFNIIFHKIYFNSSARINFHHDPVWYN